MAIYHLTAKTVSRGASVTAAVRSDYIERSGRYANDRAPTTHLGPSVAAMERKGIRTMRGSRNRQREAAVLQSTWKEVRGRGDKQRG